MIMPPLIWGLTMLHLSNHSIPLTPFNSLVSLPEHDPTNVVNPQNSLLELNLPNVGDSQPTMQHLPSDNPTGTFTMGPSWFPLCASGFKWTWINGSRPFITNGEVREPQHSSSYIESDSVTVTMFNLDSLNEVRPEVMQGITWDKGSIPESLESFIKSLLQCVNRGRFRFELGNSSSGPRLSRAQT